MSLCEDEFIFSWIIKNYSFSDKRNGDCLTTPHFEVCNLDGSVCKLHLYPRGSQREEEGYVSLHLRRYWSSPSRKKAGMEFRAEFINMEEVIWTSDKKKAPEARLRRSEEDLYIFDKVMKIDELQRKMKKHLEDTLTVRCRLSTIKSGTDSNTSKKYLTCKTTLGVDEVSFVFNMQYRRSSDWLMAKQFSVVESHFEITLKAPKEDVLIEIRKIKKNSLQYDRVVKCKATLLSREGKGPSNMDSFLFDYDSEEKTIWSFPSFFKRSTLDETFLIQILPGMPMYKIKLEFNFLVSNGIEKSDLIAGECLKLPFSNKVADVSAASSLQSDLRDMFSNKIYADIQFEVGEETVNAHKSILASRSPVFSAMFSLDIAETRTGTIEITDMNAETLKLFLEFLYTGMIEEVDCKRALGLLVAAEKYQVPSLKDECSQFLTSHLDVDNICDVISVANMTGQEDLKAAAFEYIQENATKLLRPSKGLKK